MQGTQQIIRLQVPVLRSQCLHCFSTRIFRASTDTDSMEFSMQSIDTILQPEQVTSPIIASGHSSVDQQVMDKFTQMKTMLSSFLRQKQETTPTAFCNYLPSEVEGSDEKDFQTFRREAAVKLLSSIQSRAEE